MKEPDITKLLTAPSLSVYTSSVDGFKVEQQQKDGSERDELVKMSSGDFTFGKVGMDLIEDKDGEEEKREVVGRISEPNSPKMYLATGLGIDGENSGDGGDGDGNGDEEYCKRMVDEYPGNPFHLKKYAQILQSKGDLHGAEDYYYSATLADPEDGEVMSQYAKLVWELHHDQDKTSTYFARALHVAPRDCHILAAYASFLWEIDNNPEEDTTIQSHIQTEEQDDLKKLSESGHVFEITGFSDGTTDDEAHYRKMVDKNPSNSLFLGNYAQFLYQVKGDLEGAEQYYLRAILADPGDGQVMSQYAQLVWELYHDQVKASNYFERAVQATPGDCNVLAGHASFLWDVDESEDDEKHIAEEERFQAEALKEDEYYSRAILAEPKDGDILSQYAKHLWEQLHDQDKASFYFEQSVKAAPDDCDVLAAYATFLWEIEE